MVLHRLRPLQPTMDFAKSTDEIEYANLSALSHIMRNVDAKDSQDSETLEGRARDMVAQEARRITDRRQGRESTR